MARSPTVALTTGWESYILTVSYCAIIFAWFLPRGNCTFYQTDIRRRNNFCPSKIPEKSVHHRLFWEFIKILSDNVPLCLCCSFCVGQEVGPIKLSKLVWLLFKLQAINKTCFLAHRWLEWPSSELKATVSPVSAGIRSKSLSGCLISWIVLNPM